MTYTMFVQNPEDVDNQGLYLKAEGEAEPWQDERDCEEFDAILNDGEMIANLRDAQKWAKKFGLDGTVTEVRFI